MCEWKLRQSTNRSNEPELRDDEDRQLGSVFATKRSIVIKSSKKAWRERGGES